MARPARVFMRVRKPCLRARRRLFGWNVRFPFATLILLEVVRGAAAFGQRPTGACKSREKYELQRHRDAIDPTCNIFVAIDHDRLRDLTGPEQIDTRVHPKLQECFSSQLDRQIRPVDCTMLTHRNHRATPPNKVHRFSLDTPAQTAVKLKNQIPQAPTGCE